LDYIVVKIDIIYVVAKNKLNKIGHVFVLYFVHF